MRFENFGYIEPMGKRTSYAWAYGLSDRDLDDPAAEEGLRYARRLAEMARAHSKAALAGEEPPFPLTPADIAFEEGISESTVRRRIALARRLLYGTRSDSGIYYQKARVRALLAQPVRICTAPDCEEPLPWNASKRRAYCNSRCRRRHHYQLHHPGARPAPHLRGARIRPPEITPAQLASLLAFLRDHREDPKRAERRRRAGTYRGSEEATRDPARGRAGARPSPSRRAGA